MNLSSLLKKVALIDITIFVVAALISEIKNWTVRYYVNFLTVAGFGIICIGILSLLGEWGTTRSFRYQYASSAGKETIPERTKRLVTDAGKSYSFFILMGTAGVISIIFAIIVDTIWG